MQRRNQSTLYVHTVMDTYDLILPGSSLPVQKCPSHLHGDNRVTSRSISVSHIFGVACGNKAGESKASRVVLQGTAQAQQISSQGVCMCFHAWVDFMCLVPFSTPLLAELPPEEGTIQPHFLTHTSQGHVKLLDSQRSFRQH